MKTGFGIEESESLVSLTSLYLMDLSKLGVILFTYDGMLIIFMTNLFDWTCS